MADEFTPHLNLTKPEVGASDKTCGDKLSANADALAAVDMVEDALVSLIVERLGNDALDTATGNVRIHAVEVDYVAFGPENSYAAPVAYPDFKPVKT